jgi:hypothetical protein
MPPGPRQRKAGGLRGRGQAQGRAGRAASRFEASAKKKTGADCAAFSPLRIPRPRERHLKRRIPL